ncbi:MAG: tRNA (adenosine(37)-N6)-threonylcarbamoyltransferase complex ATPase subunit type 1 TsaE [Sphingobium sp.]|nr:tRNA (adenosine(37)-N6)-threonylcarbamoyltransferase complex ATPase subunit type 1 TsaE [Sphingobium sp.]MBP6112265.1 tRNA (adenosine(37)-N6)-threonylcarbamoyltransferase complex ATPase subunit type 1 TsaE [Sphingobium sp.]MBP8670670.1 tRNA (adenosine(37)-N6)-threonylcarbamoyltransferase complex ATPase subunit type 1 TsaE [Sphingobium sp.]MBP9156862.1 tRNA (adenosine(37)-N6)-threonylcarbamoyltransferase complex ATPase subunit type 1 TsaE [Sphingobium sp.]MCC6481008.1 tRNA (adenosine(37)-N6)-
MTEVIARGEEAMLGLGAALARVLRAGDVIALSGGLGAGKTTLARGLLAALGLEEEAPSPTFAIVQPYAPPEVSLAVAHVDLYRLDDPAETEELGLDEYLADGALLIEWPERMGNRMWRDALHLSIEILDDGARRLTASLPPSWKERWPFP